MSDSTSFWKTAFEGLKGHPEATLAGIAIVSAGGMAAAGVNLLFAGGLPIAIYHVYYFRMVRADHHLVRMSEWEVQCVERTIGLETRKRSHRALERRLKSSNDRPHK